jgi:hypothetical protein
VRLRRRSHGDETTLEAEARAAAYAAGIYGSIVTTAIVGAFWDTDVPAREITLTLLATMGVFWLAHTWAAIAGERIHTGSGLSRRRVTALAREEWPMVEAGFAPILALALGWAGLLGEGKGEKLALAIGVVQLFAWGFVLGRRVYGNWPGALIAGLGNGLLGLVLVELEILVLH